MPALQQASQCLVAAAFQAAGADRCGLFPHRAIANLTVAVSPNHSHTTAGIITIRAHHHFIPSPRAPSHTATIPAGLAIAAIQANSVARAGTSSPSCATFPCAQVPNGKAREAASTAASSAENMPRAIASALTADRRPRAWRSRRTSSSPTSRASSEDHGIQIHHRGPGIVEIDHDGSDRPIVRLAGPAPDAMLCRLRPPLAHSCLGYLLTLRPGAIP